MRHSPLRHPLAILRQIIGLGQKELGDLVGRSPRTLQSIELGKHALSDELATRISHETGISLQWLLAGDPSAPPVAQAPAEIPYSKEIFDTTRAHILAGKDFSAFDVHRAFYTKLFGEGNMALIDRAKRESSLQSPVLTHSLASILASVYAAEGVGRAELAIYRMVQFAKAMRQEFGQRVDERFTDQGTIALGNGILRLKGAEQALNKHKAVFTSPFLPSGSQPSSPARDLLDEDSFLDATHTNEGAKALWEAMQEVGQQILARRIISGEARVAAERGVVAKIVRATRARRKAS